jgi:NitT/TauT family transport system substrate-binding protein
MRSDRLLALFSIGVVSIAGCFSPNSGSSGGGATTGTTSASGTSTGAAAPVAEDAPSFSLAWSEYPSWSVFGVAHEMGLVDGDKGKMGEIETKWGVDIVLEEKGYDSCLNMFASKNCDAVCMTNMDALIVSPNRDGVAILPTSTSNGADACIVVGVNNLDELKPHKIYGLKGTVSEYCFVRCVEEIEKAEGKGYKPGDFQFTNQDPGVAAAAMAGNQESHRAIMVWNPFVLQTLNDRADASVLFDSSKIPGEIVDMVVMGRDSLDKPGGDRFARAVIDTFYRMNEELVKPDTGDKALVALGEKFSRLGLEDMKVVVEQTQFYKNSDEGIALLSGDEFKTTMETVARVCGDLGLVTEAKYGFGNDASVPLVFDASYIESWKSEASP